MNDIALHVRDLQVRLGNRPVLQEVAFDLPRGSMLAVLGPNGSGKSTLLRTLIGLVPPSRGTYRVLGSGPGETRTGAVGYVPQIKTLDRQFPARSVDLVGSALRGRWPGRLTRQERERAQNALSEAAVGHLSERSIGSLSGGELQRVYLARAVILDPELLFLDEPEAGVDAVGTADFHSLLDRYRSIHGTTIVLVTHDWDAARYHASHVLILRNRQIAFGLAQDTFTEESLHRAFGHEGHVHGHRPARAPDG